MNATKVANTSGNPSIFMSREFAAPSGGGGGGGGEGLLPGVVGVDGGVVDGVPLGVPAATTLTESFMPLAQWPAEGHMK